MIPDILLYYSIRCTQRKPYASMLLLTYCRGEEGEDEQGRSVPPRQLHGHRAELGHGVGFRFFN